MAADLSIGVTQCSGEVESLQAGGWSGSAASAFSSAWTEWRDGASKVADALARWSAALAESAAAYDSTDAESSASLNLIAGQL